MILKILFAVVVAGLFVKGLQMTMNDSEDND